MVTVLRTRGRPRKPKQDCKDRITFSVNHKVVEEFKELCIFNKENPNRLVEQYLATYIEDQKRANYASERYFESQIQVEDSTNKTKSILIADDEKNITEVLASLTKTLGYTPIVANSGSECISLTREKKPDLILLDIMMNDMDGWEVAEKIKNDPELKRTPIIMITGKSPSNDIRDKLHLIDNYLMKPVTSYMLKEAIDDFWSGKLNPIEKVKKQLKGI
jgi:CheY-like chemotaxis protein